MDTESKYTSPPPRSAFDDAGRVDSAIASATGTSMPRRRARSERHAPAKNGRAE